MILLVSFATGFGSALFPPLNVEAYLVGLAALNGGPTTALGVLLVTVGHMVGKLLFYALGRGWLLHGLPGWVRRRHRLERADAQHAVAQPANPLPADGVLLADGVRLAEVPSGATTTATSLPLDRPPAPEAPLRPRRREALVRWLGLHRVEQVAGRPWATVGLCFVSSCLGLPPFAVVAVLLGRFRMPVVSFLLVGGLGRLVRFAAVAGAGGLLLG